MKTNKQITEEVINKLMERDDWVWGMDSYSEQIRGAIKLTLQKQQDAIVELIEEHNFECLSQFAYQGADIPKKIIKDLKHQGEGFRRCKKELITKIKEQDERKSKT